MADRTIDAGSGVRCQRSTNFACIFALAATLAAAMMGEAANAAATLDHAPYGTTQAGQAVEIYTMTNDHGAARAVPQLWRRHYGDRRAGPDGTAR